MTKTQDEIVLEEERAARIMGEKCPIYAPNKNAQDTLYHATRSGMRSAACGERWIQAMAVLIKRGLTPIKTKG